VFKGTKICHLANLDEVKILAESYHALPVLLFELISHPINSISADHAAKSISRGQFLTTWFAPGVKFAPRVELCPLGGMFTPSFTLSGEHSLLFRRI
jgi:hypothetical protein